MTTNYTGSGTSYPANVRIIAGGDAADAANLGAAGRDLADRSEWQRTKAVQTFSYSYGGGSDPFYSTNSTSFVTTVADGGYLDIPSCIVDDKILITAFCPFKITLSADSGFEAKLVQIQDYGGANGVSGGLESSIYVAAGGTHTTNKCYPLTLHGMGDVQAAGTTRIYVSAKVISGTDTLKFDSQFTLTAVRFRI
jgi:hypothetical protein